MATATAIRKAREHLRVSKGKAARSITGRHRDNLTAAEQHGPWTRGEAYKDTGSASRFATKKGGPAALRAYAARRDSATREGRS